MAQARRERNQSEGEASSITPKEQQFIEALLLGKSITEAAMQIGIGRRTGYTWMSTKDHPVRQEYEKQRIAAGDDMRSRVAALHRLTFTALEDLLGKKTAPAIRFQAAKLIYEGHLRSLCEPVQPLIAPELVIADAERTNLYEERQAITGVYLFDAKGRERVTD